LRNREGDLAFQDIMLLLLKKPEARWDTRKGLRSYPLAQAFHMEYTARP
jgi:hypothetical protein